MSEVGHADNISITLHSSGVAQVYSLHSMKLKYLDQLH